MISAGSAVTVALTAKSNGFPASPATMKLTVPDLVPTDELCREAVKVSDSPGPNTLDKPSASSKPSGSVSPPRVTVRAASLRTVNVLLSVPSPYCTLPRSTGTDSPSSMSIPSN